jgi:Protein of unknown function DUF86
LGYGAGDQAHSGICHTPEYENDLDSRRDQMAVERGLEILGEAARRISSEFQQAHPEIDWRNTVIAFHNGKNIDLPITLGNLELTQEESIAVADYQ